jgi:dihydrofolate reductase
VVTDAAEEVARLRNDAGKDMVLWGSLSVARSLMKLGLIDRYEIIVCPVVLGGGTPLFGSDVPGQELQLKEASEFDRGSVALKYVT